MKNTIDDATNAEWREAHKANQAASVEVVPEQPPMQVVAAVATGSGAVSSADVLEIARLLEMQACDKDQTPADAGLLMYCTEVLRQHAAAMTERQPLPNVEISHDPERRTKI